MILPSKHLSLKRALLTVGAEILIRLKRPKTVSRLWEGICQEQSEKESSPTITFDWFILALDLLFTLGVVEFRDNVLTRRRP